jgi:hypothetical protein
MRALIACSFALSGLIGCLGANPGRAFDTTHVSEIRPAMTRDAIVAWFGEPFTKEQVQSSVGCTERWIWYSAPSQVLFVNFDDDGKVCAH